MPAASLAGIDVSRSVEVADPPTATSAPRCHYADTARAGAAAHQGAAADPPDEETAL